jgi:CBS domain-containing protein/uncharacterized protein (DUF2267 family)
MSLERFTRPHLVVQTPETRLYDAIRAMEDNHVGAVLVHDGAALIGIVTDRDIGLKVAGSELDVFEVELRYIMSAPVATLGRDASADDVAALMIAHGVRRIPLVEGSAVIGLVTLDDLILEHALDAFALAAIVRAQLSAPAKLKPAGLVHPAQPRGSAARERTRARHEARRRQRYARLLKRTMIRTGLPSQELAECALHVVLSGLLRRVTPEEAGDFLAQLPSRVREYAILNISNGPDPRVNRGFIERTLGACLDVGSERARQILRQVTGALAESVSQGELEQFNGQLPRELQELFAPSNHTDGTSP